MPLLLLSLLTEEKTMEKSKIYVETWEHISLGRREITLRLTVSNNQPQSDIYSIVSMSQRK